MMEFVLMILPHDKKYQAFHFPQEEIVRNLKLKLSGDIRMDDLYNDSSLRNNSLNAFVKTWCSPDAKLRQQLSNVFAQLTQLFSFTTVSAKFVQFFNRYPVEPGNETKVLHRRDRREKLLITSLLSADTTERTMPTA